MQWALYVLGKHPDIQKKLREEIRKAIPSLDSEVTSDDIDGCHYLQAVCSEVLRLWAPVPLTLRIANVDTRIAGHFIPKGTTVILAPAATNTSKELWGDDAMEFKPERFLGPDGKSNNQGGSKSNFAFMSKSADSVT
jgi:cytochrome P450